MHCQTSTPIVRVLGGLSLISGTRRLPVPPGSRRLLAYLALHPAGVDRRCAAGVLWPTVDDGRAAGNLRSALWRLQSVDCRLVRAEQSELALCDDVEVDLARLEGWAARVLAGVPEDLLAAHGPVSPETAAALADGVRTRCTATWGIGLTGVAGPEPVDGHEPGRVYLGISDGPRTEVAELTLPDDRAGIRRGAVAAAVTGLLERLV